MHQRTLIRNKIAEIIEIAIPGLKKVYTDRVTELSESQLDAAVINFEDEESEPLEMAMGGGVAPISRTADFSVMFKARSASALADVLDGYAEAAEAAVAENNSLDGLAEYVYLSSSRPDWVEDQPIGELSLTFTATYIT